MEMLVVDTHSFEPGTAPDNECGSRKPHDQEHEFHLAGRRRSILSVHEIQPQRRRTETKPGYPENRKYDLHDEGLSRRYRSWHGHEDIVPNAGIKLRRPIDCPLVTIKMWAWSV
jgi:hypothetical protein